MKTEDEILDWWHSHSLEECEGLADKYAAQLERIRLSLVRKISYIMEQEEAAKQELAKPIRLSFREIEQGIEAFDAKDVYKYAALIICRKIFDEHLK